MSTAAPPGTDPSRQATAANADILSWYRPWVGDPADEDDLPIPDEAQAIRRDMARNLGPLGLQSLRATVVDMDTLAEEGRWLLLGEPEADAVPSGAAQLPPDSAFPTASVTAARLAASAIDETVVQRMSPRRWGLAWRVDDRRVVLAVAHFLEGRVVLEPADTALVRLVCDAGLQPGAVPQSQVSSSLGATDARGAAPSWPTVERRQPGLRRWLAAPALGLLLLGGMAAGWQALVAVPDLTAQELAHASELARLRLMADRTVTRSTTVALASGDYGEVQVALSGFAALGYFEHAVVTNAQQRVVALVGSASGARIGDALSDEPGEGAHVLELMQGTDVVGRLVVYRPRAGADLAGHSALQRLPWMATGGLVALALAGLLVALRWPKQRSGGRRPGHEAR